ncbi:MAG TPA: glycosyltransferase [Patescibacteria group bacterium]|nr:glycosyltransferase [Patescibacteria group bacterium]
MSGRAARIGAADTPSGPPGVRVVLDARPLQEPERAPVTATYLENLLGAFDADPLAGESFALLLRSDLDDPTTAFASLDVVGRRLLPPTHLLRSAALTVDAFVLSGASIGAAWRSTESGAAGAVYHAVGGGVPLATGLPLVVTLLDLAPWELPATYQRNPATRFGQRLRSRLLRDAAAIIVGTEAVAASARRLLHVHPDRLRVVPFAPRPAFRTSPGGGPGTASDQADSAADRPATAALPGVTGSAPSIRSERTRLGLPERYLVYSGRYDARQDLRTLLRALESLAAAGRPDGLAGDVAWPPRVLLVGTAPEDRSALARAAGRVDVGESLAYAPHLPDERLATLVRGARAAILPALSDATGLPAIDAIASGTPVIASNTGALPEVVGTAGILVPVQDHERLATALATVWTDDGVHGRLAAAARARAALDLRTWADVARATREVYAEVGRRG